MFLTVPDLNPANGQLRRLRIRAVNEDAPKTTINQASFGFQRELAQGMIATADFVYTRGSNLASLVNLNQPLPNRRRRTTRSAPCPIRTLASSSGAIRMAVG